MPSCESFEKRIENPKVYFIFFSYFYSAVIGDNEWKRQVKDPLTSHLGNVSSEAFGHILLINNYKAWLHLARGEEDGENIKTDYDKEEDLGNRLTLADYLLKDLEFDTDATDFVDYVVSREEHQARFKRLEKERRAIEKTMREDLSELTTITACDEATDGDAEGNAVQPSKRRKLSELKKYTSKNEGKKLFGGWAAEAHEKMMLISQLIKSDVSSGGYVNFVRAFLNWKRSQQEYSGRQDKENDDGANGRVNICRDLLWDL
jgi:hypothetical protein